jgi:hypothetical protein
VAIFVLGFCSVKITGHAGWALLLSLVFSGVGRAA